MSLLQCHFRKKEELLFEAYAESPLFERKYSMSSRHLLCLVKGLQKKGDFATRFKKVIEKVSSLLAIDIKSGSSGTAL